MRRPQKQVCVQPRPLAVNMVLPAFAAERRAAPRATAAQLTASRRPNCIKAAPPLFQPGQIDEQTGRRTDTVLLHRSCFAYYAGSTGCQQYHQQY